MRAVVVGVAVCLMALGGAGGAVAAEPRSSQGPGADRARLAFSEGTTHYNLHEYKEALNSFQAAYRAVPDPVFLFNIAQCHRQLGTYTEAASFYRTYLRESPSVPNKEMIQRLISEMDRAALEQRAKQPPTGTESPVHTTTPTPEKEPIAKPPSETKAPLVDPAPSVTRRADPIYKQWWLWTVVGVVAAGTAVGIGVGVGTASPAAPAPATSLGIYRPY